jgi:hypothetical protein
MTEVERRLAAILSADVVGYSRLIAERVCPGFVDTCTMSRGQGFPDLFLSQS